MLAPLQGSVYLLLLFIYYTGFAFQASKKSQHLNLVKVKLNAVLDGILNDEIPMLTA